MKWLFSKTMLGALIGAVVHVVSHGPNVESIATGVSVVLTAAGVRHAIEKNGVNAEEIKQ